MNKVARYRSIEELKQDQEKQIDQEIRLKRHSDYERFMREIYYYSQIQKNAVANLNNKA